MIKIVIELGSGCLWDSFIEYGPVDGLTTQMIYNIQETNIQSGSLANLASYNFY